MFHKACTISSSSYFLAIIRYILSYNILKVHPDSIVQSRLKQCRSTPVAQSVAILTRSRGGEFDPVPVPYFVEIDHETISMFFLLLRLIQDSAAAKQ